MLERFECDLLALSSLCHMLFLCLTIFDDSTPDGVQLLGRSVSIGCCDVVGIVFAFSFELCRIHLVLFYSYVILECTRYH